MSGAHSPVGLRKSLGPVTLWGLGVGQVISGMYFGWNLGLLQGGSLGLALATLGAIVMYTCFTFCYAELACAIPKAGGAFDYTEMAFGPFWGLIAGLAQIVEFLFAPPAIAMAIGAYFNLYFPSIPVLLISIAAYILFTGINIKGVREAARIELLITILAVGELLIFAAVTLPHFKLEKFMLNSLPQGTSGVFAAIPFALWFFLAIEGLANVAEETHHPQKNIILGFGSAMATLALLCILTFLGSIGVGGWEKIVYPASSSIPSDSPLPLALLQIVGQNSYLFHLLISIGMLGLIASFHGIILTAGRASLELGRKRPSFSFLAKIHPKTKTPVNALLFNMAVGILACLTGRTGEIIIIACFGALVLYIISLISFFNLRIKKPELPRPFKAPFYPFLPMIALVLSLISLISMIYYYLVLGLVFSGIMSFFALITWGSFQEDVAVEVLE